jgi:hypothetical protein
VLNIQALVYGMSAQWQRERAQTQLTLGALIEALKQMPPDTQISGLGDLHSYRGYYSDLSFEPEPVTIRAADLLKQCEAAMGQVFEGYKGGDFVMGALTPMWVSSYGTTSGMRLMRLNPDGSYDLEKED